jgi:hypothetical protein
MSVNGGIRSFGSGSILELPQESAVTTFYIYIDDLLEFLGTIDGADKGVAAQLARAIWNCPLKVLTWRLCFDRQVAA